MDLNKFISECANEAVKAVVARAKNRGDNLVVFSNDDTAASGQYVVSYGGYTVTRK